MVSGDAAGWIAAGISAIACVVSWVFANKSKANSEIANETAIASLERSLRTGITVAQDKFQEVAFRVEDQKKAGSILPVTEQAFSSAVENYLNAHESAAMYYCLGKIDYKRYKTEYRNEIKVICDPNQKEFSRLMHPEDQSEYRNLWNAYNQFWGGHK